MKQITIWKALVLLLIAIAIYHDWYMHELDKQITATIGIIIKYSESLREQKGLNYQ